MGPTFKKEVVVKCKIIRRGDKRITDVRKQFLSENPSLEGCVRRLLQMRVVEAGKMDRGHLVVLEGETRGLVFMTWYNPATKGMVPKIIEMYGDGMVPEVAVHHTLYMIFGEVTNPFKRNFNRISRAK